MAESPLLPALDVRAAGAGDGPLLEALAQRCGLHFVAERDLGRTGGVVLVAEQGGAVVGFVALQLLGDEAEVFDLCVLSSERRRGIGQRLLLSAGEELRARGGIRLLLEVRRGNLAAIGLYQRMGFELVGERRRYYQDGEDALIFTWLLPG